MHRRLAPLGFACAVCAASTTLVAVVALVAPGGADARPAAPDATISTEVSPSPGYEWPLGGQSRVTRPFDPPPEPWLPGHRGVDLAGHPGLPVYAAGDGVVVFAGRLAGRGVVSIRHGTGLRTTYEPLAPAVRRGTRIEAGDVIGRLSPGHRGCPTAACLHWGLRNGRTYLDPLTLLGLGRVRLLPFGPAETSTPDPA